MDDVRPVDLSGLKWSLRWRHGLALVLIAASVTLGFLLTYRIADRQEEIFELMQIAGRQTMLSQRIAFNVRRLPAAAKINSYEYARRQLVWSIELLERDHKTLIAAAGAPGSHAQLNQVYFAPPIRLDLRVREYIRAARRVAGTPVDDPVLWADALGQFNARRPTEMMRHLGRAVSAFERDGQADIARLQGFQIAAWGATLLLLLAELIFIFRPMERRTVRAFGALQRLEHQYRELIENAVYPMLITVESKTVLVNRAFAELFGYRDTAETLVLASGGRLASPAMMESLRAALRDIGAGRQRQVTLTGQVYRSDGKPMWVKAVLAPADWFGVPAVQTVLFDITEQRNRERELQVQRERIEAQAAALEKQALDAERARQESERSRRFAETLIDTMPNPVAVKGLDGRYTRANPAFHNVHFAAGKPVLGQTVHELVPPDVAERITTAEELVIATGQPHSVDYVIPASDGDRHYLSAKAPILSTEGQVEGLITVIVDVTSAKRLEGELRELATRDPLTGACNRRGFRPFAEAAADIWRLTGREWSLIAFDIDHFKQVNDVFGHATGDQVLELMAAMVASRLRADDCLVRLGGEEFAILLPGVGVDDAARLAERLRATVEATSVPTPRGPLRFTISLGVVGGAGDMEEALKRADAALYQAKRQGRNQVVRDDIVPSVRSWMINAE